MSYRCDYCGSYFAQRSGRYKHMKNRCLKNTDNPAKIKIVDTQKMSTQTPSTETPITTTPITTTQTRKTAIKLKNNNQSINKVSDCEEICSSNMMTHLKEIEEPVEKIIDGSIEEIVEQPIENEIKENENGNKTHQLLIQLIQQNQDLKDNLIKQSEDLKQRLEKYTFKKSIAKLRSFQCFAILFLKVYLNDNTDMYEICDQYGISNPVKLAKLSEMCKDKNKLAYLARPPMSDYIKQNDLLCVDKKDIHLRKDNNGFSYTNLNEFTFLKKVCQKFTLFNHS